MTPKQFGGKPQVNPKPVTPKAANPKPFAPTK